ncbi:MAG: response regulator [Anaerolineae bacterium]
MSPEEFAEHVADAYEHLYDLVYLRTHPLQRLLAPSQGSSDGRQGRRLHQVLLQAIDELDPGSQAPPSSWECRRHRLMVLRYLNGLDSQAVADQLSIGLRHYFRERKAAIDDVARILWERLVVNPIACPQPLPSTEEEPPAGRLELLRLEAARLARADRSARLESVVEGVFPVLQDLLRRRKLDIQLESLASLPDVCIASNMLRQVLLAVLGYLVEHAEHGAIRVSAQLQGAGVRVSLAVEPPRAIRSDAENVLAERLAALAEITGLTGVQVLPVCSGQSVVGFELRLPVAEHTVLVVDDNEDVLALCRAYLSPHGYRVETSQTGPDALHKAHQLRPCAIILDLMMPEQDGWELLQVLLNRPETCRIPIIVCTVLRQRDLALALGASGFVQKPITEHALLSPLQALDPV